jgi:two-component system NtrC family sensor kinase
MMARHSLSLSLFLWLFAIVIVAFAAYAFVSTRTASEQWMQTVYNGAARSSEVIKHSTHYAMLLNRKEDVHHIIRTIARTPGVVGVRVYDKQGTIIFSAADDEIGRRVDLQAEACVICHDDVVPLHSVPAESRARVYRQNGERVLGLINPIENAPECSNAGCHAHPREQTVLGVLDVKVSMADADTRLATTRRQVVTAAILIAILAGAVSAVFIYGMVRRPVKRLIEGAARVAHGDLDTRIDVGPRNEIGQLARAFNRMTSDLHEARREITEWSRTLERKVLDKTAELGRTQRQVVHMEKMASLGKLSATVAHELNNPLAGILNYAKLVTRTLDETELPEAARSEVGRYLKLVQRESIRCGDIVRNLLLFARPSGGSFASHGVAQVAERALMLVRHHLEIANVRLETRFPDPDERIVCDPDQLQQALVALFVNAVEAMSAGGALTVSVERVDEHVEISVTDTGPGIAPEVLPEIFEPFFSTKDGESGVGLGLSVVFGIVQRHHGTIQVDTELGRGTTFRIRLPVQPPSLSATSPRESGPETVPAEGARKRRVQTS